MNKYGVMAIALLVLGSGLTGYYLGKGDKEVVIQEKVIYQQGETKVEYRDRIVTVTKIVKPDGTVIETQKTEDRERKEEKKDTVIVDDKSSKSTPILSKYSLGARYWLPLALDSLGDKNTYMNTNAIEITAGRRVFGEIWVEGGYRLDREVSLGFSLKL